MRNKVIISAIAIFFLIVSLAFFLDNIMLESLRNTFTILNGTASFITVTIAILLFNKYGIDKTIKDKNLNVSLKLLEEIKKTQISFDGKKFSAYYRPATWSFEVFEDHYGVKLLFPDTYHKDLEYLEKYSGDLYLPKEIKIKLDKILPYILGSRKEEMDDSEYAKVSINGANSTEWKYKMINDEEDISMYDYFIKWDELIIAIKTWCENNSNAKIDLNINCRVGKGESHPQASHRTGREPLDSSGSS